MGDVPNYQQVVTQDGGREGSHGAGAASRGAAATRPPWWRFWPGSEKPHQSPDGPAAANNGIAPLLRRVRSLKQHHTTRHQRQDHDVVADDDRRREDAEGPDRHERRLA